jgi:unsaturated rhamnogalacturonyl hydrolase
LRAERAIGIKSYTSILVLWNLTEFIEMKRMKVMALVAAVLLCSLAVRAEELPTTKPTTRPLGSTDPREVGRAIATNLLARKPTTRRVGYPEACTAYGSLRFAGELKDKELVDKIVARYAPMAEKKLMPKPTGVDASVIGIVPIEIYRQTNDERFLAAGKASADAQFEMPREDGLTKHTRFWIDDMFMITGLQTEAYRATKDKTYLDRAAMEMVAYIDKLQQPNGLYFHSTDPGLFYWGRGNGWMAVGSAELLSELPADHPQRAKILAAYQKLMAAVVKVQPADGIWRQVLDDDKSWAESSCTGMFTFALARGVANGWLEGREYEAAARRGWTALSGYVDAEGNVKEVCIGTNRGKNEEFYLNRPRAIGDLHGQGATVWAAWAMIKLDEKGERLTGDKIAPAEQQKKG